MAEFSEISKETTQALQEAIRGFRQTLRRAMDLSAADISAIVAEPLLSALGWDVRNPRHVRRPEDGTTLRLLSSGRTALTIRTFPGLSTVPDALPAGLEDTGEWIVLTNGATWKIFNYHNPVHPFRIVSLADAAATREALPVLAMLQREAFQKDTLTEAWIAEAVDRDIERILARHLDGSDALITALQQDLASHGMAISSEDVQAALSRIEVTIGAKPAAEISAAAPAAPAEKVTPAKARPKAARARKPAAKKAEKPKPAAAAKPKAKPAAKAAAKAAAAPAKAAPAEAVTLPSSPEEMKWPRGATHVMHRKKNIAFIRFDKSSGESTLLPGSLITPTIGKALNPQQIQTREDALSSGDITPKGDMLEVQKPISFKSPRAAASFAAATLVKDLTTWKTKSGKPMEGVAEAKSASAKEAASETAPAPAETETA